MSSTTGMSGTRVPQMKCLKNSSTIKHLPQNSQTSQHVQYRRRTQKLPVDRGECIGNVKNIPKFKKKHITYYSTA
jgi:hypothetical protein